MEGAASSATQLPCWQPGRCPPQFAAPSQIIVSITTFVINTLSTLLIRASAF